MALKDPTMRGTPVLSALAVASTLALAACGEATESGNTDASTSATTTATTEADREISADHDDTDIMFAQMMIPHHQQAVEMSEMPLAKEGILAQVVEFAQGVIDAQGPEIDRMNAMLGAWGPQPLPREDYYNPIATLCRLGRAVRPQPQICSQIR